MDLCPHSLKEERQISLAVADVFFGVGITSNLSRHRLENIFLGMMKIPLASFKPVRPSVTEEVEHHG